MSTGTLDKTLDWPWSELELEPTQNIPAIKKAYAKRLKIIRPDEQPDAYQVLRHAYEWALSMAREELEVEADGFQDIGDAKQSNRSEAFADAAESEEPPTPTARELLEHWAIRLNRADIPVTEDEITALSRGIESLPIMETATASTLFADMVLSHDTPDTFLFTLAEHFQWGHDYRQAHWMGMDRLSRLRELLQSRDPGRYLDHDFMSRAREFLRLDRLLNNQPSWKCLLFATLTGPVIRNFMAQATPNQRAALGQTPERWHRIDLFTRLGFSLRLAFVLSLAFALAMGFSTYSPVSGAFFLFLILAGGSWILCWFLARDFVILEWPRWWMDQTIWMSRSGSRLLITAVMPAMLAALIHSGFDTWIPYLQYWVQDGVFFAYLVIFVANWPTKEHERVVYLPGLALLTFGLLHLFGDLGMNWLAVLGMAMAWDAVCSWMLQYHEHAVLSWRARLYRLLQPTDWKGWVFLILAFKFVLGLLLLIHSLLLPLFLRLFVRGQGANAGILALSLALLFSLIGSADQHAALLLYLPAALFALLLLQSWADWLSDYMFHEG